MLLSTVHGSNLYGLAGPASDWDGYEVVLTGRTWQRIHGHTDITTVVLDDFTTQVAKGVPQALEALWSPYRFVARNWAGFFEGLRPDYWRTLDTYARTIRSFMWVAVERDDVKRARHAMRLALNRETFAEQGRFNPRLDPLEHTVVLSTTPENVQDALTALGLDWT